MTKTKQAYSYNFNVVGNPTITEQGVASGFSVDDYIVTQNQGMLSVGKVLYAKFTVTDATSYQLVFKQSSFNNFYVNNGYFTTYNYQTSVDQNITTVSVNTTYYLKITFLETSRVFSLSTDGVNFTDYTVNDNAYGSGGSDQYLYFGAKPSDQVFLGSIDLTGCYIEENNVHVWDALTATTFYGDTYQVRKGLSYQVRVRADGKWDFTGNQTFTTAGQEYFTTMETYDGLSMDYIESYQSADKVDFSNTVLPWKWQYSTALSTDRYCLMPQGQNYENVTQVGYTYNFDVIGSPTIDDETESVSGFSSTSYLRTKEVFNPGNNPWKIKIKFQTGNSVTNNTVVGSAYTNSKENLLLRINPNDKMWFLVSSSSSTWDIIGTSTQGSYTFQPNTIYYGEASFDGSNYIFKYSTDGENYIEDINVSSSSTIISGKLEFGAHTHGGGTSEIFGGTLDLSGFNIEVNGTNWWTPEFVKIGKRIIDYTVMGSPTISSEYVASGFSTSNYLSVTNRQTYASGSITSMEIAFKFHTPTTWTSNGRLINSGNSYDNFAIDITKTRITLNMAPNGYDSFFNFDDNKDYWIKYIYNGTDLILYYSEDGIAYTILSTTSFIPYISDTSYSIGYRSYGYNTACIFNGSIDLNNSYIKINGNTWWNGARELKETLQGCTYNFTDDGSAVTLNCFAVNGDESVVLTPDNSYGTSRLLGTVSIPSHTVYEYDNGTWTQVPSGTTLHQYDRVDGKATVAGFWTDGNGQRYAVCVADAAYRIGRKYWSNSVGNTSLPDYTSQSTALTATESSTWNMDTIRNGNDLSSFPAFNSAYSKTIEHSGVIYRGLLPNAAELQMIWSNRVALDGYDPTLVDYPTNSLSSWNIGGGSANCWSSTESSSQNVWYLNSSGSWDNYYNKLNSFGIITVFEIPVDENGTVITS